MNELGQSISAIALAVIGVAIVAVIVSKHANTPQVLQAAGNAFGGIIGAAVAPVTGGTTSTGANIGSGVPMLGNLLGSNMGSYGLTNFGGG